MDNRGLQEHDLFVCSGKTKTLCPHNTSTTPKDSNYQSVVTSSPTDVSDYTREHRRHLLLHHKRAIRLLKEEVQVSLEQDWYCLAMPRYPRISLGSRFNHSHLSGFLWTAGQWHQGATLSSPPPARSLDLYAASRTGKKIAREVIWS